MLIANYLEFVLIYISVSFLTAVKIAAQNFYKSIIFTFWKKFNPIV